MFRVQTRPGPCDRQSPAQFRPVRNASLAAARLQVCHERLNDNGAPNAAEGSRLNGSCEFQEKEKATWAHSRLLTSNAAFTVRTPRHRSARTLTRCRDSSGRPVLEKHWGVQGSPMGHGSGQSSGCGHLDIAESRLADLQCSLLQTWQRRKVRRVLALCTNSRTLRHETERIGGAMRSTAAAAAAAGGPAAPVAAGRRLRLPGLQRHMRVGPRASCLHSG